jgi:hypothetical protein
VRQVIFAAALFAGCFGISGAAKARSAEGICHDVAAPAVKAAQACLTLLAAKDLSLEQQIDLHRLRAGHLERGRDYTLALIHVNRVLRLVPDDLERG